MFQRFLKKSKTAHAAMALYSTVVKQARDPQLYALCDVPDTEDGRYDMILLHMFLVLERLAQETSDQEQLKQCLFDSLFDDLDKNLREMGYGDAGVRIRIQKMIEGFYGRMSAYRSGIKALDGDDELRGALRRNLYRHNKPSDNAVLAMCAYMRDQWDHMVNQEVSGISSGRLEFSNTLPIEKVTS